MMSVYIATIETVGIACILVGIIGFIVSKVR